jgi:hypothetical protein
MLVQIVRKSVAYSEVTGLVIDTLERLGSQWLNTREAFCRWIAVSTLPEPAPLS